MDVDGGEFEYDDTDDAEMMLGEERNVANVGSSASS
jgi:hypothetical protein